MQSRRAEGENEEQLLEWSRANKTQWTKTKEAIGATGSDTVEDLSEVAPEDYEGKVHELTTTDQLKTDGGHKALQTH